MKFADFLRFCHVVQCDIFTLRLRPESLLAWFSIASERSNVPSVAPFTWSPLFG